MIDSWDKYLHLRTLITLSRKCICQNFCAIQIHICHNSKCYFAKLCEKKHLRDKKKTYNIISQPKVGNRHRNVEIRGINGHKTKQVEICLECGDELGGIRNKTYHDPFI